MISIKEERLDELKEKFKKIKVAVIGDMMLDGYQIGKVNRISPEAPVPVVLIDDEYFRFGGAANVALNIKTLGGVPYPFGIIGYDNYGTVFSSQMKEHDISSKGLIVDDVRPTTAKTRVIAHNQHVVRIDRETNDDISEELQKRLIDALNSSIDEIDAIILQDYNKGVLVPEVIERVIELANSRGKIVTVDPKFNNFFNYQNVTVMKPNRKEAEDVLGIKIKTADDVEKAGSMLLEKLNAEYVLLTLSQEGIAVFDKNNEMKRMPTKARKVADVSGAGDTVISTLTMALAAGADILEASYLANYAGGIVCEDVGIVPIDVDALFETVKKKNK